LRQSRRRSGTQTFPISIGNSAPVSARPHEGFWRTTLYRDPAKSNAFLYIDAAPLLSYLARTSPKFMTTSEKLGRAMIKVARDGYPKPVLESEDINAI